MYICIVYNVCQNMTAFVIFINTSGTNIHTSCSGRQYLYRIMIFVYFIVIAIYLAQSEGDIQQDVACNLTNSVAMQRQMQKLAVREWRPLNYFITYTNLTETWALTPSARYVADSFLYVYHVRNVARIDVGVLYNHLPKHNVTNLYRLPYPIAV